MEWVKVYCGCSYLAQVIAVKQLVIACVHSKI